jgi:MFS family permease
MPGGRWLVKPQDKRMSARNTWSLLPRKLKILLISMIMANIGSRVYRPFMPLYILSLGGSVALVGLFFTIDTIAAALLRPFGGWMSDSIGRLQTVGIGTVFGFAGMLGYAVAPSFGWLLVATLILAFGRSMVGPSFHAYTAEVAPEGGLAQTFGVVNGLFALVDVIGPLLGGWVAVTFALEYVFWVAVGFMAAASILRISVALRLPYRWHSMQLGGFQLGLSSMLASALGGGLLTWLLITDSLRDFGISLYHNLESVLLQENGFNEAQIGLVFSMFAVIYLLSSIFGSRLADYWSAPGALALGAFIHVAGLGLLVTWQTIPAMLIFFVITGLAFGIADPAFDAMLARAAPRGHLGMTFGLFQTAISFAAMPAPYLGALMWENGSPMFPFAIGGIALLAAGLLTWLVLRPRANDTISLARITSQEGE